jgi:hypothetical protein
MDFMLSDISRRITYSIECLTLPLQHVGAYNHFGKERI